MLFVSQNPSRVARFRAIYIKSRYNVTFLFDVTPFNVVDRYHLFRGSYCLFLYCQFVLV
jgi:hypothetical protein